MPTQKQSPKRSSTGPSSPTKKKATKPRKKKPVQLIQITVPKGAKPPKAFKKILALDLGTKLGWAKYDDGHINHGKLVLQTPTQRRFEGAGMKWLRLRKYLKELVGDGVDLVCLEEVRRHIGTAAAHAYGGALAEITAFCEENAIPYQAFPVASVKKHATGKGNASKALMLEAAKSRGWDVGDDDDQADALWILDLSITELIA